MLPLIRSTTLVALLLITAVKPQNAGEINEPAKVRLMRVPEGGIQPQVASDARGAVHMVYFKGDPGHGDLFYVHTQNGGATFSKPLQVNSQSGSAVAVGNIRGAHIA